MTWTDDKNVVGAQLAGSEWNAMVTYVTTDSVSTSRLTGTIATSTLTGTINGSTLVDDTVTMAKLDTTGTASSNFMLRGDGVWSRQFPISTPVTNYDYSGLIKTFDVDSSVALGNVCYLNSSGKMVAADADSSTTCMGMLGLAVGNITGSTNGTFLLYGEMANSGWSFTTGGNIYVNTTAGGLIGSLITGSGKIIRIVGHAISSSVLHFNPDSTYIELS